MDVEKIVAGMFMLILVFLLVSRASEVNSIIAAGGDFVTRQTQILQGVTPSGVFGGGGTLVK